MLSTAAYQQQVDARRHISRIGASREGPAARDTLLPEIEARLAAIGRTAARPARYTLFEEGDRAATLYQVAQGVVMAYKLLSDGRRQVTGFLFPGDFLGLAFEGCYVYGAETVTQCRLVGYPAGQLERLLQTCPELDRHMLRLANHELLAAQQQMILLGRKTAEERLASLLCTLSRRQAGRGEADNPVWLPMCRGAIADYLGLTLETVSRLITKLCHQGLISRKGHQFLCLEEPEVLAEMAEG